jgi:hypothetical protein
MATKKTVVAGDTEQESGIAVDPNAAGHDERGEIARFAPSRVRRWSIFDVSMNKAALRSKEGESGAAYASAQQRRRSTQSLEVRAQMAEQLALGIRPAVGEGALGELPDPLVRVELRGVPREAIEVESGTSVDVRKAAIRGRLKTGCRGTPTLAH